MTCSSRPLTVAKITWEKGSILEIKKGKLGTLAITIEEGGRKVDSLREIKVTGRIIKPLSSKEIKRRERGCECSGQVDVGRYVGTYTNIKIIYPEYSRIVFANVVDLDLQGKVLQAVRNLIRFATAKTLPKTKSIEVTLWAPPDLRREKIERTARELKVRKEEARQVSRRRGPGRKVQPKGRFIVPKNW